MRRQSEALAAILIGLVAVIPIEVLGVKSGLLAGTLGGLLAVPIVAVVAAVGLLVVKLARRAPLHLADLGMFGLDLVLAFLAAAGGLVTLGPIVGNVLRQFGVNL